MYLEKINGPADVKALNSPERTALAAEMRTALIQKLSHHGGHCGPNLGLVEATIALHTVFDSPKDRFVFDVSHQTYPHKMLTGRSYGFLDPARYDDITGYSAPQESAHDPFTLGHTSTSVSLACGLAKARDAKGEHHNVVAIIGDGSLSGGELKRIEIATMLARGTKMSIFDEPEAGIDLWSFQNLISVFEKMHETIHGSILIISHQERILETADKIVVLVDGEVRTIGTKDEIMPVLMEASRVCSRLADKV